MNVIKKIYQYAEPNLSSVGWLGFFGFPVYYYVWTYLFPQPYESLWLRVIGTLLCLGLALRSFVPIKIQKYLPYYYYFTMGYCLPFFFGYMMIMNDYNNVWVMSFTSSICLHILLIHETKSLIIQTTISILIAYFIAIYINGNELSSFHDWAYIPIFLFVYIFGNVFYFRNQISHEAKVSIAKSFGAGIAHEMRNPLSAIKSSVDLLQSLLHTKHPTDSVPHYMIEQNDYQMVNELLDNMNHTVDSANETINLLLTSIDQNRIPTSTFKIYTISDIAQHAIQSFSYKNPLDRLAINIHIEDDFRFLGSDILLKYAFYNLFKNAFYYQNNENFHIEISITTQDKWNQITVTDNGAGIAKEHLQDIFKDFYTHGKNGGYGLGLPFCRRIMEAFGGKIECASVLGQWTEFTLLFPTESSSEMRKLKEELVNAKSLLYVGNEGDVRLRLKKQAQQMGFHIETITLPEATKRKEYDFEFDVIMVDLNQINRQWDLLTVLESQLHFSEAQIHYIYDADSQYPIHIERHLSVYPLERSYLLDQSASILYHLFFELPEIVEADRNVIPLKQERSEKCILIVDDNHSVRNLTAILLEKQGYHVLQASNGQEALGTMEAHEVDLILMDIEMPILDGIETTSTIRRSQKPYRHIPILGHTGDTNTPTLKRIRNSGMNDYIIKPADTNNLLDKLANWI
ncbi:hybrid sensor histidine kinase/response regulator [Vibrio gazogenes]|uniref:histidine kinase n=1 Tax=Vibrio gazogenes DSM 21264 = NBRC 103151 TaxID=1123492 RepID=A0A1M4TRW2_VIBGA|nr:hybrid sensor histidine kinase/response regulator [Vibrio gazogenes]USP16153.1 response regulator [Vibrio gazogenes]SHE47230.1 two-component system, CAI-1 autoinducer sensor kinase/phosphatase CqsS [Vibrio gazogenes DSM 21264] [Vibrio gazogenes DSM 21264 = NBRC 103151]SJN53012.1 CAI-1 autoinducer sensor kinase/phosphatase CqsS [Vibrio gazogenes]